VTARYVADDSDVNLSSDHIRTITSTHVKLFFKSERTAFPHQKLFGYQETRCNGILDSDITINLV
jgi:hypothetical protein